MDATSPSTVAPLVDHLFRRESGRLVAMLARRLGAAHLHVAEDVVQDALVAAMQTWPFTGIPDNPTAWLLQTARNRALDQRRRDALSSDKERALAAHVEACLDACARWGRSRIAPRCRASTCSMPSPDISTWNPGIAPAPANGSAARSTWRCYLRSEPCSRRACAR